MGCYQSTGEGEGTPGRCLFEDHGLGVFQMVRVVGVVGCPGGWGIRQSNLAGTTPAFWSFELEDSEVRTII